jgi:acyl-CoA dehydrogenase
MYAGARTLRIADGPDDVHVRSVARSVLKPYRRA